MGLCWSHNTKFNGKDHFPYIESALLSAQLWKHLTRTKIIIQIIYDEKTIPPKLIHYKVELEKIGCLVKLFPSGDIDCVLKSQVIRLLAFKLPEVSADDLVMTSDVDAFVMTSDIMRPILLLDKKIWIYRYQLSRDTQSTFMMCFIAASKFTWKELIKFHDQKMSIMIEKYNIAMNNADKNIWDLDQKIITFSILDSGLCTVASDSTLWKRVNLSPRYFYLIIDY